VAHSVVELAELAAQREQPGRALSAVVELRERLDELEEFQVDNARGQGWSWSEIAYPLRVTRQAVHRKYAKRPRREGVRGRIALSAEARRCVVRARREAAAFGHESVGTDHLLLGVLAQDRIASALAPLGLTVERALFAVTDLRGFREERPPARARTGPIPISQKARGVLDQSLREASRLGDQAVGAEHVLLALVRDRDSAAGRAFDRAGVAPAAIEKRLREVGRT
jgi:Clp amino terminal domain, pathogenicity island component